MKFLFSILIPPVGVAMKNRSPMQILLNLFLCVLGIIPGIIHAVILQDRSEIPQ